MLRSKGILSCLLLISTVFAAESGVTTTSANSTTNQNLIINSNALATADQDYNKLNEVKRKAAIAAEQAKLNPPVTRAIDGRVSSGISETIATSIVIDEFGKRFATLQFSDGSTLTVEPGDKIGKYSVRDITMSGVYIANCSKKCTGGTLIKRAFPIAPQKPGSSYISNSQSTNVLPPSNSGSNDSVPAITGG